MYEDPVLAESGMKLWNYVRLKKGLHTYETPSIAIRL
jgi:hypothetical protein